RCRPSRSRQRGRRDAAHPPRDAVVRGRARCGVPRTRPPAHRQANGIRIGMSVGVDFDFTRWLAARRGALEQQAREGAVYAFSGERKFRRTLMIARPVTMAIEATTRLWRDVARTELLGTAVKVSDQQYPRVFEAAKRAGATLN